MDYSKLTLADLLSHSNKTIRRHAIGILKVFHKIQGAIIKDATCTKCDEIHDVELAGGHDLLQAERVAICECSEHPDDEYCQTILNK